MKNIKKKKVAAAAFTFLMALSSISGATIASPDLNESNDSISNDAINLNNKENPEYSPTTLNFTYLNYQNIIEKYNPGLDHVSRDNIYESAISASREYDVPVELILAIIGCESEFKPHLYGALDDTGLMQIRLRYTYSWAKGMGANPPVNREALTDIDYNIHMGTYILSYLLNKFDGDIHQALTAYNAGEGYVAKKLSRNERLPITYIQRVDSFYQQIANVALW